MEVSLPIVDGLELDDLKALFQPILLYDSIMGEICNCELKYGLRSRFKFKMSCILEAEKQTNKTFETCILSASTLLSLKGERETLQIYTDWDFHSTKSVFWCVPQNVLLCAFVIKLLVKLLSAWVCVCLQLFPNFQSYLAV